MANRILQLEGKEVTKPELNTLLKQLDNRVHTLEVATPAGLIAAHFQANDQAANGFSGSSAQWDTETWNTSGGKIYADTVKWKIKVSEAGYYRISCTLNLGLPANQIVNSYLVKNASTIHNIMIIQSGGASTTIGLVHSVTIQLAANDYVFVTHDAGTVVADDQFQHFSIEKMG